MGVTFRRTNLDGVLICDLEVYEDPRGFFVETFHAEKYAAGGIVGPFVQDNFSRSIKGTLRGLHFQARHPQGKLISVLYGCIWDVAVDIRRGSPTRGRWVGITLSDDNRRQLFVPEGFAHGFCVLSERADVMYKCTDIYHAEDDRGLLWNDPELAIDWPFQTPLLSNKDAKLPRLADLAEPDVPVYRA